MPQEGKKKYTYTLLKPTNKGQKSICKVRGITLNFKKSPDINFNLVNDMVAGKGRDCVTVLDEHKIVRNPTISHVITKRDSKKYKIVFDKYVIGREYNTHPYGY